MGFQGVVKPIRHADLTDVGSDSILGDGSQFGVGTDAGKPAGAGLADGLKRLWYAEDTDKLYRHDGAGGAWIEILAKDPATGSWLPLAEKAAALGVASLNASSKVVQEPASKATPSGIASLDASSFVPEAQLGNARLQLIAEASPTAALNINGIPQTFRHLLLTGIINRGSAGSFRLRVNGDSGAKYDHQSIKVVNTTVSGLNTSNATIVPFFSESLTVIAFEILILHYAFADDDAARMLYRSGSPGMGTNSVLEIGSAWYNNSPGITEINLLDVGNNSANRVALYGLR